MRKRSLFWTATTILAAAVAVGAAAPAAVPADAPPQATPDVKKPLHVDPKEMEAGLVDITLAFAREDVAAAVAGIDRLEGACRKLDEKDAAYPREIVVHDMAFHRVLDRGRATLRDEGLARFDDITIWMEKSCGRCHAVARREGLLPPKPEASPAPSAAPGR